MKNPFFSPDRLAGAQYVIIAQQAGIVKLGIAAGVSAVGIGHRDLIRTQVADDSNDRGRKIIGRYVFQRGVKTKFAGPTVVKTTG